MRLEKRQQLGGLLNAWIEPEVFGLSGQDYGHPVMDEPQKLVRFSGYDRTRMDSFVLRRDDFLTFGIRQSLCASTFT